MAIETFKILNKLSPPVLTDLVNLREKFLDIIIFCRSCRSERPNMERVVLGMQKQSCGIAFLMSLEKLTISTSSNHLSLSGMEQIANVTCESNYVQQTACCSFMFLLSIYNTVIGNFSCLDQLFLVVIVLLSTCFNLQFMFVFVNFIIPLFLIFSLHDSVFVIFWIALSPLL